MFSLQRLEDVFNLAVELSPAERAACLDRECAGDDELRGRVERLLREFESGTSGVLAKAPPGSEEEGPDPKQIGSFKIVSQLGEGGMGRVYEATQESPRRSVALKVIRAGLGTREGRRRFAREAELLAQLKHPGIAQIYTSGLAIDDLGIERRFIAMELVRGRQVLAHAQQEKLTLRQRIELLARVADAVQHAHQRGVIHRDLKPANILVEKTAEDPIGQPKVLDFGVARLLDSPEGVNSQATEAGRIIGTLAYMSPEQVDGDQRLVDTRADVYALGVLGYELLGGQAPTMLAGKSLLEAARIIKEVEPRRLGEASRQCRGEVETIIAKAMHKDRDGRYPGAGEMSADLRRFLRNEPIVARPPTAMYQLRKFARRNRAVVGGASAALLALVAGLVVSTVLYARAARAAERSDQVVRFLKGMIGGINPTVAQARDTSLLKEIVDSSAEGIGASLAGQPGVEAELRDVMADVYYSIGDYAGAEKQRKAAIEKYALSEGPESSAVAGVLIKLADVYHSTNRGDEAIAASERAVAIQRRRFGEESKEFAEAIGSLGESHRFKDIGVRIQHLERAVAIHERLAGPGSIEVGRMLEHLGGAYVEAGRSDEAQGALRRSYEIRTKLLGPEHMDTVNVAGLIGDAYLVKQRYAEAEPLCRVYAEKMAKVLPETHPAVPLAWASLALALHKQGKLGEAIELYRAQIGPLTKVQGADDLNVGTLRSNLAVALTDAGELDAAAPEYAEALRVFDKAEGAGVLRKPSALLGLSNMRVLREDYRAAEGLARESLELARRVLPARHAAASQAQLRIAGCLIERALGEVAGASPTPAERSDEAAAMSQAALDDFLATVGEEHMSTWQARGRLGAAHALQAMLGAAGADRERRAGQFGGAERELLAVRAKLKANPGLGVFPTRDVLEWEIARALGRMYAAWNAFEPGAGKGELAEREQAEAERLKSALAERRRASAQRF